MTNDWLMIQACFIFSYDFILSSETCRCQICSFNKAKQLELFYFVAKFRPGHRSGASVSSLGPSAGTQACSFSARSHFSVERPCKWLYICKYGWESRSDAFLGFERKIQKFLNDKVSDACDLLLQQPCENLVHWRQILFRNVAPPRCKYGTNAYRTRCAHRHAAVTQSHSHNPATNMKLLLLN